MDSQEQFHNEDKFPLFIMERLQIYSDTDRCNITKTVRCSQKLATIFGWIHTHYILGI